MNDNIIDSGSRFKENRLNGLETRQISSQREHDTKLSNSYTKTLGVLESPDFFIPEERPVFFHDGYGMSQIEGKKAIVNPDNNRVLSVVGANYKLVTNTEVFNTFDAALAESDIDLTGAYKTVYKCGYGQRTILSYAFPAYETTITDREVGDVVRFSITASNSYDGFSAFRSLFESIRLVCKNSMVSGHPISCYTKKHTQGLSIEHAAEKIKEGINMYLRDAEMYRTWANETLSAEDGIKILEKLCVKKGYTTEVNEKKLNEYLDQWLIESRKLGRNRWSLYNAMTHIATHKTVQQRTIDNNNQRVAQDKRESELREFLKTKTDWYGVAA